MKIVLEILGVIIGFSGIWGWIVIMMDAFEDELWKGLLMLVVPIYGLYYGAVEFDHEQKWLVYLAYLFGTTVGVIIFTLGAMIR